jgi:hypothetical protein
MKNSHMSNKANRVSDRNRSAKERPLGCWDVSVVPAGFWGDLPKAEVLWRECLNGRTSDRPLDKLLAMGRLFGINEADPDAPYRFANLGWTSGAYAAASGVSLQELVHMTGDDQKSAKALVQSVWEIRGIAGTEKHPLVEQRRLLKQALGPEPVRTFRSLRALTRASAIAGWLAFTEQHLVSARVLQAIKSNGPEWFLAAQLEIESKRWDYVESKEALARCIGGVYSQKEKVERKEIMLAVEQSLATARKQNWSVARFVQDGIRRGAGLAMFQPVRTVELLKEIGDARVEEIAATFEKYLHCSLVISTDVQSWDALQDWLPAAHKDIIGVPTEGAALLLLRHAYDFMFWLGFLRQVRTENVQLKTTDLPNPEIEGSDLPDWATPFIGKKFDPTSATDAGWINQGSAQAHFGLERGKSLWVYKLDHGNECHPCGRIWWRFLIVKLDRAQRIESVRTEVHEVFADGHGEQFCTDFLPDDVTIAIEALECATQSVSKGS